MDMTTDDFQFLIDSAARILKSGGKLTIQFRQDQIRKLAKVVHPEGLQLVWLYSNPLQGNVTDNDYIKSSWRPILVFGKDDFKSVVGSDVFARSFETLTKPEDAALQISTRFSSVDDNVLDPYGCM